MARIKEGDYVEDLMSSSKGIGYVSKADETKIIVQYARIEQLYKGEEMHYIDKVPLPKLPKLEKKYSKALLDFAIKRVANDLWSNDNLIGEWWDERYMVLAKFQVHKAINSGTLEELL